jgi:uncharacterized protein
MSDIHDKPMPQANELSRPYWEAARQGQLVLQKCGQCGTVRHYPRLLCDRCHSREVAWTPASGRGRIHSWTVCHHVFHPGFAADVPYVLVTVDLEEGVRALGRWSGDTQAIGTPVQGRFEVSGARAELVFSPA